MDAAREDDRSNEMRLYLVIRDDILHGRDGLSRLAGRATWSGMEGARAGFPERADAYDRAVQPKIAVRVKNEGQLRRVLEEAHAAGLPAVGVDAAPGVPGAVCVGPVTRSELPAFLSKQRLLSDEEREDAMPLEQPRDHLDDLVTVLLARGDAGIPWGKLAAQAGHATLASVAISGVFSDRPRPDDWTRGGMPMLYAEVPDLHAFDAAYASCRGLPCARIVDAGRTVFAGEKTPTVIGIGPALLSDLPAEVRQWLPAERSAHPAGLRR